MASPRSGRSSTSTSPAEPDGGSRPPTRNGSGSRRLHADDALSWMMVGVDEARAIADEYAKRTQSHWFEPGLDERDDYFVARLGFVGSMGVVIAKANGALTVLGSAYTLEDWLWGYERGLLVLDGTLRVLAVHDSAQTAEMFLYLPVGGPPRLRNPWPRRAWVRERLDELPADFRWEGDLGLTIPSFQTAAAGQWFEFEVVPSE